MLVQVVAADTQDGGSLVGAEREPWAEFGARSGAVSATRGPLRSLDRNDVELELLRSRLAVTVADQSHRFQQHQQDTIYV